MEERNYVLSNGDPVEIVFRYNDRIVVLYKGMRLDRPADIIGRLLFPVSQKGTLPENKALVDEFVNQKEPDHMRRKVIRSGDTVCIKFVESNRKAVYTLTNDEKTVTVRGGEYPVEGYLAEASPLGRALVGMGTNDIVTFYDNDEVIVIQVLSFFLKKTGLYQKMKEQKTAEKAIERQKANQRTAEKKAEKIQRIRTIKTGDTVCVEFLDTKEKKAFKIVPAIVEVKGEFAAKPYRPTSYDSKTITEANPDEDTISETSPLAKSVLGKKRGDIASFKVGNAKTDVRIIAFFDNDAWLNKRKSADKA